MKWTYLPSDRLPHLAWCARVGRGAQEARVRHGPWVETGPEGFAEGAWDAPLRAWRPDEAATLVGTAARRRDDAWVFAASSNLHDRLYLRSAGDELLVSNSLVFLLAELGDAPDPGHATYAEDFVEQALAGVRRTQRTLPMRAGAVTLHECGNLVVWPDLRVERQEKPRTPPPDDYAGYLELLDGSLARLLANAAAPERARPYTPLATLSRGYDSPAVAALARRHGCREAVTFSEREPGQPAPEDDGTTLGQRLGLEVAGYPRFGFLQRRDLPEAEFCVLPPGADVPWSSLEERLPGRVLLTGRFGEDLLTTDAATLRPDFQQHTASGLAGSMLTEFRLRVGFLNFPPLGIGWQHPEAIHQISCSPAMRPWSVGGSYDRPILRRILEEAGVERALFGQQKMASAFSDLRRPQALSPGSRKDYLAFYAALAPPARLRARLYLQRALHRRGLVGRRYRRRPRNAFLFHWGVARTRPRYELP